MNSSKPQGVEVFRPVREECFGVSHANVVDRWTKLSEEEVQNEGRLQVTDVLVELFLEESSD